MKLKNKKTGEIVELLARPSFVKRDKENYLASEVICFDSLAELNAEWEDYEEPKDTNYWYIDDFGRIQFSSEVLDENEEHPNNWMARKLFGNYFETKEEAEKAVEKLKAWKRLEEAGFEFGGWTHTPITKSLTGYNLHIKAYSDKLADYMDDLELIFGGEE